MSCALARLGELVIGAWQWFAHHDWELTEDFKTLRCRRCGKRSR